MKTAGRKIKNSIIHNNLIIMSNKCRFWMALLSNNVINNWYVVKCDSARKGKEKQLCVCMVVLWGFPCDVCIQRRYYANEGRKIRKQRTQESNGRCDKANSRKEGRKDSMVGSD